MPPSKKKTGKNLYIYVHICMLYRTMKYSINKQENIMNSVWSNNGKL